MHVPHGYTMHALHSSLQLCTLITPVRSVCTMCQTHSYLSVQMKAFAGILACLLTTSVQHLLGFHCDCLILNILLHGSTCSSAMLYHSEVPTGCYCSLLHVTHVPFLGTTSVWLLLHTGLLLHNGCMHAAHAYSLQL